MKIAWIGTGVMGCSMALHLKEGGHEVHVYNRSKGKTIPLQDQGCIAHDTIMECVKNMDVIFTMVGYPRDVEEVYTKMLPELKPGTICVDMTTSSPKLAQALYKEAQKAGIALLDAPVSGGDSGAKKGTLSIMVGGDEDVFQRVLPLFRLFGTTFHYMGKAGNGQHTKACNQIAVAGAVAAMSESLVYAKQHDIDMECMLGAITGGAAGSWQIQNTAPRVLQGDFAPGFYIKHIIKDMHIVQEEMGDVHLAMLDTICKMYEKLARDGEENAGTQALIHYYD